MTNRTLFEIGEDLEALDALLAEVGGDVSEEDAEAAVDAWLSELGEERNTKLDRYARYISDVEGRIDAKMAERERLAERIAVEQNRVRLLKARLLEFLRAQGVKKLETDLHAFTVASNGGKIPVVIDVPPESLPTAYRKVQMNYSADQEAIRMALDAGLPLGFARYGERGQHLRIR